MIQLRTDNDLTREELVYHFEFLSGDITRFPAESFEKETAGLSGKYELRLLKFEERRSPEQARVLEWFCRIIAKHTGNSLTEVMRYIKCLLLPRDLETVDVNKFLDPNYKNFRNSSELSTTEFYQFLEELRIWAQIHLNISLPLHDDGLRFKPGIKRHKFYP